MFQDTQMKIVIKISLLIFIILVIFLIFNTFRNHELNKQNQNEPVLSLTTDSNIFKIDSILMYSSANALNNAKMQEDYWDLNLYQYSDLAISIDNNVSINETTEKNTIKKMYINNITYPTMPEKGIPTLYYKDPNSIGVGIIDEEKLISERLDYNVIYSNNTDSKEPTFYADCSNPIILSAVNKNIVDNFVIRNTNSAVTFDGNLLLDATVLLSTIKYDISFSIHIINYLDEEYVCNLSLPILLSDENDINTIYDGAYQITLTDLSNNKFYKVTE